MKKYIFIPFILLALAISVWTPTPAAAKNMEISSSVNVGRLITSASPLVITNYSLGNSLEFSSRAVKVKVLIRNRTRGILSIRLAGTLVYNFSVGTGGHYIYVRAGTYKYTVTARCGKASGSVKLSAGKVWTWTCV